MRSLRTTNTRARRPAWKRRGFWEDPPRSCGKSRHVLQRKALGGAIWTAILSRARTRAMHRIAASTARMYGVAPVIEFTNDLGAPPTRYPT